MSARPLGFLPVLDRRRRAPPLQSGPVDGVWNSHCAPAGAGREDSSAVATAVFIMVVLFLLCDCEPAAASSQRGLASRVGRAGGRIRETDHQIKHEKFENSEGALGRRRPGTTESSRGSAGGRGLRRRSGQGPFFHCLNSLLQAWIWIFGRALSPRKINNGGAANGRGRGYGLLHRIGTARQPSQLSRAAFHRRTNTKA